MVAAYTKQRQHPPLALALMLVGEPAGDERGRNDARAKAPADKRASMTSVVAGGGCDRALVGRVLRRLGDPVVTVGAVVKHLLDAYLNPTAKRLIGLDRLRWRVRVVGLCMTTSVCAVA